MDKFELQDFNKRIGLNTKLDNISTEICKRYEIGDFVSNELITIGYEDYNLHLMENIVLKFLAKNDQRKILIII